MTEWLVRLQGHAFDLEELSNHFTSADRNVNKDEDGYYYLRSSDFNLMSDSEAVRRRAQDLIERMNGAVKLLAGGGYRPVDFDAVIQIDDSGNRHHHITLSSTVGVRSRVTGKLTVGETGETVHVPRTSSGPEALVDLADRDNRVADAISGELGDQARHASEKYKAPRDPMTLDEAQGFVRSVIRSWIATL